MHTVKLNNGVDMPMIGMGTYPLHKLKLGWLVRRAVPTPLAWAVLSWYLGLGSEDRRDLLGMLSGLRHRLRRPRADQPVAARKSPTDEV